MMLKGKYTVHITQDATGLFYTLMTYENQCVPGILGRYYSTRKRAERGARLMLSKV
jgi:hypothetical protein